MRMSSINPGKFSPHSPYCLPIKVLPLPIAGIMSDQNGKTIGKEYALLDQMAKEMGSTIKAPYMTLSFMALLVIPSLKLSDKGLFNGSKFEFTSLEI